MFDSIAGSEAPARVEPGDPVPPLAAQHPVELLRHGHRRVDEYYWLRERENPAVLAHLAAENAYLEAVMAPQAGLREALADEIEGRIAQDDRSAPVLYRGWWNYQRMEAGRDYPIYCRRHESMNAPEQVLLDVNELAAGQAFMRVPPPAISPDGRTMAYAVDSVGRNIYTIRFRDLATGADLPDRIERVFFNMVWANDSRTLLYTRQDPETLRPYQVYRHGLGNDPADDGLVYQEDDETFRVWLRRSKSECFLLIAALQTLSAEWRYLDANAPSSAPRLFLARAREHEHSLDHLAGHFYVRSNRVGATNFALWRTTEAEADAGTDPARWEPVLPHRAVVLLEGFELFDTHLVTQEREAGLRQLRVQPWGGATQSIDFGEPTYMTLIGENPEAGARTLRYYYSSLTTPPSHVDYDLATGEKTIVKQERVLGGFAAADYASERIWATARDGTRVPISLAYRRQGFRRDGSRPLLLVGYGSYGMSADAAFSTPRLTLLDRGFVFAIAHVRGGQELGRAWYDAGRLDNKRNSFTDFIDCAEHLLAEGYGDPARIYAQGGSAGGLLMGAVLNLRPDLFAGVVAQVPFVDVVTTMLDDQIPLTTGEFDEWGNPDDADDYGYMLSYSPYDNVAATDYPPLLVTAGLHDSQVQYWEPAKWVARLRERKTDQNLLLFETKMTAGHSGSSARRKQYEDLALVYAFLLRLAGIQG